MITNLIPEGSEKHGQIVSMTTHRLLIKFDKQYLIIYKVIIYWFRIIWKWNTMNLNLKMGHMLQIRKGVNNQNIEIEYQGAFVPSSQVDKNKWE